MTKYYTPEEVLDLIKSYNSTANCNNDAKGQHIMYDEVIQIQDQNSFAGFCFAVWNYYQDMKLYKTEPMMSDEKIIDKIKSYSWTASGCKIYLENEDYHEVRDRVLLGKVKYNSRKSKK